MATPKTRIFSGQRYEAWSTGRGLIAYFDKYGANAQARGLRRDGHKARVVKDTTLRRDDGRKAILYVVYYKW